jgi:glycosyltransferase involved in cell wall biosynthesis
MYSNNRNYRAAFFTEQSGIGGGESSLLNLILMAQEQGHKIRLFCPPGSLAETARSRGICVTATLFPPAHMRLGVLPTLSIRTVWKLLCELRRFDAEIVHVESPLCLIYAGITASILRKPCVATYHGYWPLQSFIFRQAARVFLRAIYPVSEAVAKDVSDALGNMKERKVIPLGVSYSDIGGLPRKEEAKAIVGFPSDKAVIMQIARFQDIKGQMNLLEAYRILLSEIGSTNVTLVFVGGLMEGGNISNNGYMQRVKGRASELEGHAVVQFLGHREDIPMLIKAADIIVIPSEFETFSMVTIEAMAIGTPVVATNTGGPSEIIDNMITGILVKPEDSYALSNGIKKLLYDRVLAETIADNARYAAYERYSVQKRHTVLKAEYSRLINRPEKQ